MKLRLAARGVGLSAELKDFVGRRVHFSLGRFASKVRFLWIHLSDVNGPRGGVDKCCEIRVNVGLSQEVIVRERQANIHTAVAFAIERAERTVRRQLKLAGMDRRTGTARRVEFED